MDRGYEVGMLKALTQPYDPAPKVHPDYEIVRAAHEAWVRKGGYAFGPGGIDRLMCTDPARYCAYAYPRVSRDVLQLTSDFVGWLFLFDDYYGEGRLISELDQLDEVYASFLSAMSTGTLSTRQVTPLHHGLLDLRRRVAERFDDAWLVHFAESLSAHFKGCIMENEYRRRKKVPTLDEFLVLRNLSIGMYTVFDLIEAGLERPLSVAVRRTSAYQLLRKIASDMCFQVSDILAWREAKAEEEPNNFVRVLQVEHDLTEEDALARAIDLHHESWRQFQDVCDGLSGDAARDLAGYVKGLLDWVTAIVHSAPAPLREQIGATLV